MSKHTPGPWIQHYDYIDKHPDNKYGHVKNICAMADWCGEDEDERMANARLIAAAPDMLETLELVKESMQVPSWLGEVIAAEIAKAKDEFSD